MKSSTTTGWRPALHSFGTILLALALAAPLTQISGCSDSNNSTPVTNAPTEPEPPVDPDYPDYTLLEIEAGDDFEQRTLEALITASPKTVIQLPAGVYDLAGELSVSIDSIVLRGTGMDTENGTVLRFDNQTSGSQSILATGNNFVVEDLAVENSPGDGIKIKDSNGVTIRGVRVEWTNGPDSNNGAYGLYPVGTRNVLIEDSEVRGASDAGVYVGQSEKIIVRRNYVYENVAGIEIENSKFADVYDNHTTGNTGGILVFDLPGPPVQGGEATRVFNNLVVENNTPNFAPEGNIVGLVPGGTGIMILANDDIEVFGNTIHNNDSGAVIVVSYYIVDIGISKPTYDPVPEKIYIHDNDISGNGDTPQDLAKDIALLYGNNMVDIFYDSSGVGLTDGLMLEFPDGLSEDQRICIVNNAPDTRVGQVNGARATNFLPLPWDIASDLEAYNCTHASLPEIVLEEVGDNPDDSSSIDTEALCGATGEGRNVDAFKADCPNLSDYRLFADPTDPTGNANDGTVYDLTTPLFTDYAEKYRYVFLPAGTAAAWRNDSVFDFPVGTIISKTFTVRSDLRDPLSDEEIIETRLLIRRATGWKALPYVWNSSKTDAALSVTGGSADVSWIDANGMLQETEYVIPNSNNCANCHGEGDLQPIGPKARLLNKNFSYSNGTENQIEHWTAAGILTGAPADLDSVDTIPLWEDSSADLSERARGYLDINCAHCHSPTGAADTSGLLLEYTRPFGTAVGECKPPVAAGDGAGNLLFDIVPGNAAESIMVFRMDSNELDVRMPEIGRSVIHTEGVQLVSDWINAMTPDDCSP